MYFTFQLPAKNHPISELLFSSLDDPFLWEKDCVKKNEAMSVFVFWKVSKILFVSIKLATNISFRQFTKTK